MTYDSKPDTKKHIIEVQINLDEMIQNLYSRGKNHDQSKLSDPELYVFDIVSPKLKELTYGSEEYNNQLKSMKECLVHHYENNSHHPEHHEKGIFGMSLFDLMEMLADWYAATKRHDDGDLQKSLEINKKRFNISDELFEILMKTVKELDWVK